MADAGSLTGSTGFDPGNGSYNDANFRTMRTIGDGTGAQGISDSGDASYCSLTASGNTLVKTGPGQLLAWFCGTATGNITIYDGITAGGAVILAASALVAGSNPLKVAFKTGLFIVLSGAGVATVVYR
jgi:hypothetical protein